MYNVAVPKKKLFLALLTSQSHCLLIFGTQRVLILDPAQK